jgi:hypothetical protein
VKTAKEGLNAMIVCKKNRYNVIFELNNGANLSKKESLELFENGYKHKSFVRRIGIISFSSSAVGQTSQKKKA